MNLRPKWVSADANDTVHFDQFLHACYYVRVREREDEDDSARSHERVNRFFEKNQADKEGALRDAAVWWASLEEAPHGEDVFIAMTAPNMRAPAVLSPERPGTVTGVMAFSGDSTKADDRGYFSIDGGPRQVVGRNWLPHYQWFALNVITPGIHSVRTWRELNGVEVAGSSVVTQYYIGDPIPPEPPPPNPCLTNPLTPTVTVSAPGHTVTWSGTLTATDERGCKGTVSQ